ncbi:hypothetical protein COU91_01565 [Candidatus Saccharibacteria bacterium CG10_big_fil_rev_8_21_14_0_10_47_8]|nr:MAG: hypothetical protein COU91_01565 [Candidatus Saccharibacteria bacterium CG10_big_fil_rev_8_21_14_0_10_47_8]
MFYNTGVNIRQKHILLPAVTTTGSFLCMVILAMTTSPIKEVTYAVVFFCLAMIFLVSFGYLLVGLHHGQTGPKSRYRIFTLSFLVLVGLMLLSSQALNWVDGVVLVLIGCGLWFYSGHRA